MQGKIIKGIAGFYYVHTADGTVYECKAKGVFRKDKTKPLVGDDAVVDILDEEEKTGNIRELLPRKNELLRPAVANVDQALVIFSFAKPAPNCNLLDRFLIMMKAQGIPCIICFNKSDIASKEETETLLFTYRDCGCRIFAVSARTQEGMEPLREALKGKTTTVAGPSGVGKSSLINLLQPGAGMETGEISAKIERGKHTTRHSQLIALSENTYIMDTPGFSSLMLAVSEKEKLAEYYSEFTPFEPECRFGGCSHIYEPDCGVKQALEEGRISPVRYKNYTLLYEEIKEKKRYQ